MEPPSGGSEDYQSTLFRYNQPHPALRGFGGTMSSTTSGREFEEYERLVQKILEEKIREEYPSTVIKVFHNRKYRGQSGQEHQIDVSAELTLAGCRVLILAECKKYRAFPLETMMS
jgi:hypothetical protein